MGVNLISGQSSGGRSRYGRGGSRRPINEINMTPFIDVVLVLLIIFMISAPMLTQGVAVDLPKAGAPALKDPKQPLEIRVMPGQIILQEQAVQLNQLAARLAAIKDSRADTPVHLRADKKLPYDQVMQVISLIKQAGFTKLALVTEQPSQAK